MTGYWHRSQALCCECGNLRDVSPRYYGRQAVQRDGERRLTRLKCKVCQEVTTHADLLEPGTPWRDDADAPESTPHTLAARIERLEAEGVDVRWSDDVSTATLYLFPDDQVHPALVMLSRARTCGDVLGCLEQAEQLIRDPGWRTHRTSWNVEQYTWHDLDDGSRAVRLVSAGPTLEGPLAAEAERLVDERRAGA